MLATAALVGCSDSSASDCDGSLSAVAPTKGELVAPNPTAEAPRQTGWEQAEPVGTGCALLITFDGAPASCEPVHHVDAVESEQRVTITLFVGDAPNVGCCPGLSVVNNVLVQLDEPLRARQILDGSTPQ